MNLLQETIEAIKHSGNTPEQIYFIGSEITGHCCTWDEFCVIANKDYDQSYGSQQVASDLKIVFTDGSNMTRGEYDGSEWWQYSKPFVMPVVKHRLTKLFCADANEVGWRDLKDLNK